MDELGKQVTALKSVPEQLIMYWPAFFAFSAVNYLSNAVISMIPQVDGIGGTLERAFIQGGVQVLDHLTWNALSGAHTMSRPTA